VSDMIIETKNASLDLMAVTIQALHVSGKQMTLAVFRQLPVAKAYADDGDLADLTHWGLVRYNIKDEGDLWLVASHNGILFRCSVESPFRPVFREQRELADAQRELVAYREWEQGDIRDKQAKDEYDIANAIYDEKRALIEKASQPVPDSQNYAKYIAWFEAINAQVTRPEYPQRSEYKLPYEDRKHGEGHFYEGAILDAEDALECSKRAEISRTTLLLLPQLFIAV